MTGERVADYETRIGPLSHRQSNERDAAALRRIARELREMLADAPKEDDDVAGLLRDCEALDRTAAMLGNRLVVG